MTGQRPTLRRCARTLMHMPILPTTRREWLWRLSMAVPMAGMLAAPLVMDLAVAGYAVIGGGIVALAALFATYGWIEDHGPDPEH